MACFDTGAIGSSHYSNNIGTETGGVQFREKEPDEVKKEKEKGVMSADFDYSSAFTKPRIQ